MKESSPLGNAQHARYIKLGDGLSLDISRAGSGESRWYVYFDLETEYQTSTIKMWELADIELIEDVVYSAKQLLKAYLDGLLHEEK